MYGSQSPTSHKEACATGSYSNIVSVVITVGGIQMVLPSKSNPLLGICDTSPSSGRSSLPHLRNSKLNAAHVGVLTLTLSSDSSVSSTWLLLSAHPLTEQHNVLPIGIFFIATNVFSDLITGICGWFQTLSSQPPHSSHDTTLLKMIFHHLLHIQN